MLEELLLFSNNVPRSNLKTKITVSAQKRRMYVYRTSSKFINLGEIRNIIEFINSIKLKHRISLLPIVLDFGDCAIVADKLTYILLECICFHLIKECKCNIRLRFYFKHNIFNEGIKQSHLKSIDGSTYGNDIFVKHFNFDICGTHFRRIVNCQDPTGINTAKLVQEIDSFLKFCGIQEQYCNRASDIVGELIDNSLEHSQSDCLIDIDVTNNYVKNGVQFNDGLYCGVNIVVLNFSNILIGDEMETKINNILQQMNTKQDCGIRYKKLLEARENHSKFWGKDYTEKDFNIIASFQHKISSRIDSYSTGGTGLTQLVKGLEDAADAYNCYMLTGVRKINFIKETLIFDNDNWVGFNKNGDFFSEPPSKECITNSDLIFPGTAYNLNFVMKREVM